MKDKTLTDDDNAWWKTVKKWYLVEVAYTIPANFLKMQKLYLFTLWISFTLTDNLNKILKLKPTMIKDDQSKCQFQAEEELSFRNLYHNKSSPVTVVWFYTTQWVSEGVMFMTSHQSCVVFFVSPTQLKPLN